MNTTHSISSGSRRIGLARVCLVLSALAGFVISGVLMHLSAPADSPPTVFGASVCAAGETVNCDYVLHSKWATVGPIPSTFLGLAYFAVIGMWFAVVGIPNYAGRRWHWLPLLVVGLGLCGSVGFMLVMVLLLPVWCTWCIAAHVVNGLIFIVLVFARPRRPTADAEGAPAEQQAYPSIVRAMGVVASSVAMVLILGLGIFIIRSQMNARQFQLRYMKAVNNAEYIQWQLGKSPLHEIPPSGDDFAFGPKTAPHTVVVFTDFECGNCFKFYRNGVRLVTLFPGSLRVVFKQYPVSMKCNPHVKTAFHYFSCEATRAAEAARLVGTHRQVHAYHFKLYESASRLDERPYVAFAAEVGFDVDRFTEAFEDAGINDHIQRDIEIAHQLGVNETPAIFLDGRRLPNWQIVTEAFHPQTDPLATVALWEALLNAKAQIKPPDEPEPE